VVGRHLELAIAVTSPVAEEARRVLWAYFDDVASRYYGRPATEGEIAAAMREDPSDDLTPPRGLLLVAQERENVLGCAGLRLYARRGYREVAPFSSGPYADSWFAKTLS
jgi:hypothetical protein